MFNNRLYLTVHIYISSVFSLQNIEHTISDEKEFNKENSSLGKKSNERSRLEISEILIFFCFIIFDQIESFICLIKT